MTFCIECGAKAPDVAKFCPQCGEKLFDVSVAGDPPVEPENEAPKKPSKKVPGKKTQNKKTKNSKAKSKKAENEKRQSKIEDTLPAEVTSEDEAAERPELSETDAIAASTLDPTGSDIKVETDAPAAKALIEDERPSTASSLAASAAAVESLSKAQDGKPKSGLFMGIALLALIAAGGGAYALGLFGGGDEEAATLAAAPDVPESMSLAETETIEDETPETISPLSAYQAAIKSGRISDLGQFARDYPENSLAKDAEAAAFSSLQRQSSVLAYNTFTEYFPDAELSAYTGLRQGADADIDANISGGSPADLIVTTSSEIRPSISQRTAELEPFIVQGDTDYVLSVIDEMALIPDLTSDEATLLLNLSARAEASAGFAAPAEVGLDIDDTDVSTGLSIAQPIESFVTIRPSIAQRTAELEPFLSQGDADYVLSVIDEMALIPDLSTEEATLLLNVSERAEALAASATPAFLDVSQAPIAETAPPVPAPAFDTPAKPIDQFDAITPEEATAPGECTLAFSVSVTGSPKNIIADCTDPIFTEPAKKTIGEWTYSPALLAGTPVQQNGVIVALKFPLE